MNPKDPKRHSDTQSQHESQHDAPHGKSQGVTTNPENVGAGAGSAPAGHRDQDSRTWDAHDNQKNVSQDQRHKKEIEERSRKANLGTASEQTGNPGHNGQGQESADDEDQSSKAPSNEKSPAGQPHSHTGHSTHKH